MLLKGLILGWSVSWPPGPVNAEIIRRGIIPPEQGGGVARALTIGWGACFGDFLWALAVASGAGAVVSAPKIRAALSALSLLLLLVLAFIFARGAWRSFHQSSRETIAPKPRRYGGYLLGFTMAATSPWNLGFWLAVIGSQQAEDAPHNFSSSVLLAACVVLGAASWCLVLGLLLRNGGKFLTHPRWQTITQAITSAVMLFFAARLVLHWP